MQRVNAAVNSLITLAVQNIPQLKRHVQGKISILEIMFQIIAENNAVERAKSKRSLEKKLIEKAKINESMNLDRQEDKSHIHKQKTAKYIKSQRNKVTLKKTMAESKYVRKQFNDSV